MSTRRPCFRVVGSGVQEGTTIGSRPQFEVGGCGRTPGSVPRRDKSGSRQLLGVLPSFFSFLFVEGLPLIFRGGRGWIQSQDFESCVPSDLKFTDSRVSVSSNVPQSFCLPSVVQCRDTGVVHRPFFESLDCCRCRSCTHVCPVHRAVLTSVTSRSVRLHVYPVCPTPTSLCPLKWGVRYPQVVSRNIYPPTVHLGESTDTPRTQFLFLYVGAVAVHGYRYSRIRSRVP